MLMRVIAAITSSQVPAWVRIILLMAFVCMMTTGCVYTAPFTDADGRLRAINPRLVYASISGFGQDGPYAHWPGFDSIAQGMGGLMSVTGEAGRGPMRAGIPMADLCAGHFCAMGILAALLERETTGQGQWVQTSLLESRLVCGARKLNTQFQRETAALITGTGHAAIARQTPSSLKARS